MAGINTQALTLGPLSQQVKARAKPNQWRKIVKSAHAKGFTVESFLDQSVPEAMKARTKTSLRAEATETVRSAYAPVEKELSQAEEKTKAIDSKRARDNVYYNEWLTGKTNQINEHTAAANTLLRNQVKGITDATATAASGLRAQIAQSVTQTPGVMSDPNQSNVLNNQVPVAAKAMTDQVGNAAAATEQQISSQEQEQAGYDASNFAFIAANEAKRAGDTWSKLSDIGDERQKLALTKAADSAKEVARLLDTEREKSNANEQNRIVAERLNVSAAGVQQRVDAAEAANQLGKDKLDETIRNNKAKTQATKDQQTIANSFRDAELALSEGRLSLGWYKAKHPAKSKDKSGASGGPSAKSKDPQDRFDYGYALVATSKRPGTPGSGNKPGKPGKAYNPDFVAKNAKLVENQLVAKGLTRKMAKAVVQGFSAMGTDANADPGDYKQWVSYPEHP